MDNDNTLMKAFGRMVGVNLGLMLLYTIISVAMASEHNADMEIAVSMLFFVAAHFILLFVVSIAFLIAGKSIWAKAGFMSLLVVLLVGFGTCLGVTQM